MVIKLYKKCFRKKRRYDSIKNCYIENKIRL